MNQVKKDELILLTIKRLGINGEGVGFYKKQTIFVDNALPGEIVEVKIVDAKDKYATGVITKFKQKSPNRVEAKCPYYEKCGGCQLQHLSYDSQLEEKKNIVVESFMESVKGSLAKGNPVYLRGFGSFIIKHRAEKAARNITKNTTMTIPAHNIPAFKPAKVFVNEVK